MVAVGGYVMGLGFGFFMNALEFKELDSVGGVKSAREALRMDWIKIRGTAKGFAVFGSVFSFYESLLERQRKRSDLCNSFFSGGLTTVFLAMDSGMGKKGLLITGLTGAVFGSLMEKLMTGFH